jgi:agmatinase
LIDVRGLTEWGGLPQVPLAEARVVVAGIPYDGSAVYRRGAAEAPSVLRRLSAIMPPIDERGRRFGELRLHDMGDLDLGPSVESGWPGVAEQLGAAPQGAFLTVMGGDHCCAIPVLAAQARRHPELAVLWVDAHPDLCEWSRGGRWTCGCALRRGIEVAHIGPSRLALVGARDFDAEEVDWLEARPVPVVTAAELARDPACLTRLVEALAGRPVHVSFDIDALDPAHAPGTEIASAGGLTTRQALDLLAAVAARSRLVGLDVCEVAPALDQSDITSLAALKIIFETWAHVAHRSVRSAGEADPHQDQDHEPGYDQ